MIISRNLLGKDKFDIAGMISAESKWIEFPKSAT